ncbi:MAG: hypothetical protein ACOVNV_12540, partial [Pirellulaceae bacterium]
MNPEKRLRYQTSGGPRQMSAEPNIKTIEETGSVSQWLRELKAGHGSAVDAIWHRYYQRVVQYA